MPPGRPVAPLHPVGNLPDLDRLRRLESYEPEAPDPVPSTLPNNRRRGRRPQAGGGVAFAPGDARADFIASKYLTPLRRVQVAFNAMPGEGGVAGPFTARDFYGGSLYAAAAMETYVAPVLSGTAASDSSVELSWTQTGEAPAYRIERSLDKSWSSYTVFTSESTWFRDAGVTRGATGTAYLYRVCASDGANGCSSPYSNVALGTAYSFFEPTLYTHAEDPARATTIKARHVTDLREAVNAVRRAALLPEASWQTSGSSLPGAIIRASHVQELRDRLAEGLASIGIAVGAFEDATLLTGAAGTPVRKVHFEELRRRSTAWPDQSGPGGAGATASSINDAAWAEARLDPVNRTGGSGVDLLSGNANWSLPLVSLPGRSGLDLGLSLTYNSRVWTRSGNRVAFDLDRGFPAPGFRLGFPAVQPRYYNPRTQKHAYLLITPNGDHVELRETETAGLYESADSSYMQLAEGAGGAMLTLRPGDGSRLTFSPVDGHYLCTEVKDRNGNYLSIAYDSAGQIRSVTDTLGRVINFNYDQYQNLVSITQQWWAQDKTYTRYWATFGWGTRTIETAFTEPAPALVGIQDGDTIPVLTQVGLPDESLYRFEYTRWGQVKRISRHTSPAQYDGCKYDCPSPKVYTERASTAYGLRDDGVAEGDCPRVMSVSAAAEEWNGGAAAVTTYAYGGDDAAGRWGEATMPPVEPYTSGARYRETYGAGWERGLVTKAEEFAPGASAATKTTTTEWAQNDETLSYVLNPRAANVVVEDSDSNRRQTVFEYNLQSMPQAGSSAAISAADKANAVSLPTRILEKTGAGTLLRSTRLTYETLGPYLDVNRRLVGLVKEQAIHDAADNLVSKVTHLYDQPNEPEAGGVEAVQYLRELNQSPQATVQHDPAYGLGYGAPRGNLNIVRRWDVETLRDQGQIPDKFVATKIGYSTTGSAALSVDPEGHRSTIEYTDSFSDAARNGTKFAYPTKVTDADGYSSKATYNYDFGAVAESQSPMPDQTAAGVYGPKRLMTYDKAGRLVRVGNSSNAAYTRWVYPASLTSVQTYTLLKEGEPPTESFSSQSFDGAGRVRAASRNMAEAGRYSGQKFVHDRAGRLANRSNPTEMAADWVAAGDDAPANGGFGWVYSAQQYDWRGRVTLSTDAGGHATEFQYGGCGCAGGATVLTRDEVGRRQKVFHDALGRAEKVVTLFEQPKSQSLNDSGAAYSTTVTTYNALDQVTRVRTHQGDANGPYQEATSEFDGHGRVTKSKTPIQSAPSEFEYNADDTVRQVKDARGVVTQLLYNNRHLPLSVSYNVTGVTSVPTSVGANAGAGAQVAPAPGVTYAYDAAGNRASMADGSGSTEYHYDPLSRLTSETRRFDGITARTYTLTYSYNPAGQLTGVIDPFGSAVGYDRDASGSVRAVNASGYAGVSQFASNIQYRAWGAVKGMAYGNGSAITLGYNVRTEVASYKVSAIGMQKTYEYHADGRLRLARDPNDPRFDRSYAYDHAGRLAAAHTGEQARGGTAADGPYQQAYTYNAFGNNTGGTRMDWTVPSSHSVSYVNDRRSDFEYDASGNLIHDKSRRHDYDAANRLSSLGVITQFYTYDGEGQPARVRRLNGAGTYDATYYLRSSVLGAVVSELTPSPNLPDARTDRVYGGGGLLAERRAGANGFEQVVFEHRDPAGTSVVRAGAGGMVEPPVAELDPLGANLGAEDPATLATPEPTPDETSPTSPVYSSPRNPGGVGCHSNYVPVFCPDFLRDLNDSRSGTRVVEVRMEPEYGWKRGYGTHSFGPAGGGDGEVYTVTTNHHESWVYGVVGFREVATESWLPAVAAQAQSPQPQASTSVLNQECRDALAVTQIDDEAIGRAYAEQETLNRVGAATGIPAALLAAIGVRETRFRDVEQVGGFGSGIFQLDRRKHGPEITKNTERAATAAAALLTFNINYHSSGRWDEVGNSTPELQLAAAIRDYNANNKATRRIMSKRGATIADLDRHTANHNYVSNVLNIARYCFNFQR